MIVIIPEWKERCGYWGGPNWALWASSRRVGGWKVLAGISLLMLTIGILSASQIRLSNDCRDFSIVVTNMCSFLNGDHQQQTIIMPIRIRTVVL